MISEDKLKACPFCGGSNLKSGYIRDGSTFGCLDCGASTHAFNPDSEQKAIDLWNTRASPWIPVETPPTTEFVVLHTPHGDPRLVRAAEMPKLIDATKYMPVHPPEEGES